VLAQLEGEVGRHLRLVALVPAQGEKNGRHGLSRAVAGSARRPPLGI
jgi:hypothetical protein